MDIHYALPDKFFSNQIQTDQFKQIFIGQNMNSIVTGQFRVNVLIGYLKMTFKILRKKRLGLGATYMLPFSLFAVSLHQIFITILM